MNLRQRAKQTYAKGVAERGNFTPSGTPLNMYKYWAKQARHVPERENFCHYWRVVAIWAPLAFFRNLGLRVLNNPIVQILGVVAIIAGIVYAAANIHAVLIGLLVSLVILVGAVVGVLIGLGIQKLIRKVWRSKWNDVIMLRVIPSLLVLLALSMLSIVVVSLWSDVGAWSLLIILLGILAIVGFGALFNITINYLIGRRIGKSEKLVCDYERFAGRETESTIRMPGRMSRFFNGILDILIFVFQVVRVKKWKICPTVDIKV